MSDHVKFQPAKGRPGWRVNNKQEGYEIGYIEWMNDMESYIFAPLESTVYTAPCLREIADFCEQKSVERRDLEDFERRR